LSVQPGPAVLVGGMIALFACSRLLATILPRGGGGGGDAVGIRALAYFIPIAAASLIAMLLGRSEIALGIVFGTSVGAVTTVVGFVALAGPFDGGPARLRRVWPFLLAAALLVMVTGFKGTLNWRDAVALLTEGLILLSLWNDRRMTGGATPQSVLDEAEAHEPHGAPRHTLHYATPSDAAGWTVVRAAVVAIELALIGALAWLGGWGVTRGTIGTSGLLRGMATSAIAGSVVSLAMVLPMMYGTWRQAEGGRGWAPVTSQIAVVLLNLCALLPVLILIPYLAAHVPAVAHWAGDALLWHEGLPKLLVFPAPMWRIDNVVLIIMGVFLLPVAIGKWNLGREEGLVLIAGYFFYLIATVASGLDPSIGR